MNSEQVASFFGRLWPHYCQGSVKVELRRRARSCPFRATVFHDEGSWWVLADVDQEPEELFRLLFHELGHVVLGHVYGSVPGRLKVARSLMDGRSVPTVAAATVQAECKATGSEAVCRQEEAEAEAWAEDQVKRWFPVLETIDRTVKETVQGLFEGGGQ